MTTKCPVLILVGFGSGNGMGIARAFGSEGFSVGLISRNPELQADSLVDLAALGIKAIAFPADAADPESLAGAISAATMRLGEPDVLIYNVVAPHFGRASTLTATGLAADLAVNVVGGLVAAQAVLPAFKARGSGTIFFTGGGWSLHPYVEAASASLGKAALRNLSLNLAEELRGTGVRVGTLTIMGSVKAGTAFDSEKIGLAFLDYHSRKVGSFPPELMFTGN
jgi:NAD(P)-dependent dehydrogenase (short-subunit alcohol dehydrogenase family)